MASTKRGQVRYCYFSEAASSPQGLLAGGYALLSGGRRGDPERPEGYDVKLNVLEQAHFSRSVHDLTLQNIKRNINFEDHMSIPLTSMALT